ncbi:MAG: hypothetical protein M1839_002290 [Geoglossum umbratile]|nr:MAG: hypothetical protein M1839_002290 [Geoglossum umbratile]
MADPITSVVAVIAACTVCWEKFDSLRQGARYASEEVLALSNEISDMNVVLAEVKAICENPAMISATKHHSAQFYCRLSAQLAEAEQILSALTSLAESLCKDMHSGMHVNRIAWLRRRSGAAKLQTELKNKREKLHSFLCVMAASCSTRVEVTLESLTAPALQNCNGQGSLRVALVSDSSQQQETTNRDGPSTETSVGRSPSSPPEDDEYCEELPLSPETVTSLQTISLRDQHSTLNFQMRIKSPCVSQCDCVCHRQRHSRSPEILNNLFGTIFIGNETCRNQAACSVKVGYCFPLWFLARAVYLVAAKSSMGDPVVGLTVKRRVKYMSQNNIIVFAETGNNEGIRRILDEEKAFPDDVDAEYGETPLRAAVFHRNLEACKILLQKGANPYLENDFGRSPIQEVWKHITTRTGGPEYRDRLKSLFSSHEYDDDGGFSELHKIVLGVLPLDLKLQLQKPLLQAQANAPDSQGQTPLWWAAFKGDADAVDELLSVGADPNYQAVGKDMPVHAAGISQNPRVYELLIIAKANITFANSYGDEALHCACNHRDIMACIKPLIMNGAKLNSRNFLGRTPLSFSAEKNNAEIGSYLLNLGADMRIADIKGETPLFHAIFSNSYEFLKLLLQHGDDGTNVTIYGSTVLHHTSQYGDVKTASILAAAQLGAISPDAVDLEGRTALQVLKERVAAPEGFGEAFERLLDSVRGMKPLDRVDSDTFFDALE